MRLRRGRVSVRGVEMGCVFSRLPLFSGFVGLSGFGYRAFGVFFGCLWELLYVPLLCVLLRFSFDGVSFGFGRWRWG